MILKFKNGSGIHIKKSNRGKFTSYCGGKVTDECIRRGKNSSDPKIRKRATFAANARKWKHEKGGIVSGVSILDSNPDAYKFVKKKYKMRSAQYGTKLGWQKVGNFFNSDSGKALINFGSQLLSGVQNEIKSANQNKKINKWIKAQGKAAASNISSSQFAPMVQQMQQQVGEYYDNPNAAGGTIINDYLSNQFANQYRETARQQTEQNATMQALQYQQSSDNNIFGTAFNLLGKLIGPKQTDGQTEIATTPEKAIQTTASPSLDERVTNPSITSLKSISNGESFSDWRNRQIKQKLDLDWELITGAPKGWSPEAWGLYTGKLKFSKNI